MNLLFYIILGIISPNANLECLHDIHISKTEIHYKTEQSSLQFTIAIFIDDLEAAINEKYGVDSLKLFTNFEKTSSDSLVNLYIQDHLKVKLDSKDAQPIYLGKEINDTDVQGMRCYLEIENQDHFNSIEVSNQILLDAFKDQRNLLDILIDRKSKGYFLLDHRDYSKSLNFD